MAIPSFTPVLRHCILMVPTTVSWKERHIVRRNQGLIAECTRVSGNLRAATRHGAILLAIVVAAGVADIGSAQQSPAPPPVLRAPDVGYEPTPMEVVHAMLRLAKVNASDMVYDLGCGDGRIVITAARQFGARGVCVDIDPVRIAESRENARQANVIDRIRFLNEDLFVTDVGDATVVTLFLSSEMNLAVRPKLQRELKRGTRIVSHWHHMGGWKPQETVRVRSGGLESPIYLWTVLDR
jgi:SAM-dependent methyltransferase